MHYIQIPEPIALLDLFTGEPVKEDPNLPKLWAFARTATLVCVALSKKGGMDALAVIDLRKKLTAPPGTWAELTEPEYEAVKPEFSKPSGELFPPLVTLQMHAHITAVLDAKRERPAALATADNGAAHASA